MAIRPRIITREISVKDNLAADMHPVLKRVYLARNVSDPVETDNTLQQLIPFDKLKGIKEAVAILAGAIQEQKRILIVGDYDADGATSCALAVRVIRALGCQSVNYLVPNRFEYGYGLTPEIVTVAKQHNPELIITVDHGIPFIVP